MTNTWRITKCLTNANPNISSLTINGKTAYTTLQKLNAFGVTLENIFTTNPDVDNSFIVTTEQIVNYFLKQLMTDRVSPPNHSEISWIVRQLKPRKARGS
jgi:hypothetical protein